MSDIGSRISEEKIWRMAEGGRKDIADIGSRIAEERHGGRKDIED